MVNKIKNGWIAILVVMFVGLVLLDQYTKYVAVCNLKGESPFVIIEGVLELRYHENAGAAWGMLQGAQGLFYVLTLIFVVVVIFEIRRLWWNEKYLPFIMNLILILSGAVGNFLDRISLQYVVDFIYVKAINFPIFNLADSYISVAVVILVLMTFFYYSEEEFDYILPIGKKKKKEE